MSMFGICFILYLPTPSFSCFFLNIRNTRCLFSEFVSFCISCLLVVVSLVGLVSLGRSRTSHFFPVSSSSPSNFNNSRSCFPLTMVIGT